MVLFLQPVFQERIWGGTQLKNFNYNIPFDHTGECWAISAHPNGPNVITNGPYQGYTLDQVWEQAPSLFGASGQQNFPLLTKILDANDKLSVQVHPDDNYAQKYEGENGKTECWYILDAAPDAEIIYGVNADNQDEINQMLDQGDFETLFHHIKVTKGDFFYVPSGTVHAIGKGIMILETQQSSDTTYRIYDYERTDSNGKQRELHLEQSKAVIDVDRQIPKTRLPKEQYEQYTYQQLVSTTFFTVEKWDIHQQLAFDKQQPYYLVSVIEGEGVLYIGQQHFDLEKGAHFILTTEDQDIYFTGNFSMIVSYV